MQGPTQGVHLIAVSIKRESTVYEMIKAIVTHQTFDI